MQRTTASAVGTRKEGQSDSNMSSNHIKNGRVDIVPEQSKPYERQIIMTNLIKTSIALAVVFPVFYYMVPIPVPSMPTLTHRLVYALRLQTPAFLIVAAAILYVSLIRLYTPAVDPINGGAEHIVLFPKNFLTNTVEQTLLNVPAQLVLASFLEESQMKVIPILVGIFVFGRITFFIGYKMSYLKRTVGYTATFIVTTLIWTVNSYFVFRAFFRNEPILV